MTSLTHAVYGAVPSDLAEFPPASIQCSPRVPMPHASLLSDMVAASCADIVVHAPGGTIERRSVMAMALRALAPTGKITVLAANTKGGTRLASELAMLGCTVDVDYKRKHQIVRATRPAQLTGIEEAIALGSPRLVPGLELWSQPGLFNWDRIDPGSQLLIQHLPVFKGRGADLGCGFGALARAIKLKSPDAQIVLVDIDQRALQMARRNVPGDGISTLWADVCATAPFPRDLDFVVMNPPFHDEGEDDIAIGRAFIEKAAAMLKPGGVLWLTANRHLPYEATLKPLFASAEQVATAQGFKIYEARKAAAAAAFKSRPVKARA